VALACTSGGAAASCKDRWGWKVLSHRRHEASVAEVVDARHRRQLRGESLIRDPILDPLIADLEFQK